MFERFTDRARRVLQLAQEEARLLDHSFIGTEHILLALIHDGEGIAAKVLESLDVSLDAARRSVEEIIGTSGSAPAGPPPFTPRAKKVLELSLREALDLGHSYIGTEHLLLGIVREGEGVAAQVLVRLGADPARVRQRVTEAMSGFSVGTKGGPRPMRTARPRRPMRRGPGGPGGPGGTIVVVGEGSSAVVPDTAVLEVGLEALADTAGEALAQVTERSQTVLAELGEHGLADTATRTTGVSLHARMDEHGRRVTAHVASYALTVRFDDIARAPAVVDALSRAAGDALRLGGLRLSASSTEEARAEAGARAVDDARRRAERLADAAGVRLGRVLSITEAGAARRGPRRGAVPRARSAAAALPVATGTDALTARVTVIFEIDE